MTLTALRCFVETVRCGTMTEASRQLYMAQPNLSRQISMLEDELGIQLFVREHRRLYLTPAGSFLYNTIKDIPSFLDSAFEQAIQLANQTETTISIGILEGQLPHNLFADRLEEFQKTHPNVTINIENRDFEALKDGLKNRVYDFIITLEFSVSDEPNIRNRILLRQPAVLAVHRKHPLAQRESLSLRDLEGQSIIALNPRKAQEAHRILCKHFASEGVSLSCERFANSTDQLLLLVETGAGIAIVDSNTRLELSPNVRLFSLPPSPFDPNVCIAYRSGSLMPVHKTLLNTLSPDEGLE